jgi:hypothetical protein
MLTWSGQNRDDEFSEGERRIMRKHRRLVIGVLIIFIIGTVAIAVSGK